MCRNAGLTEARKKSWCSGPDDIDHRPHVGAGPLTIEILDVRGARVERIVDRASATGTVSWRPTRQMAPGIYFIRLTGPKDSIVRRVIRLE